MTVLTSAHADAVRRRGLRGVPATHLIYWSIFLLLTVLVLAPIVPILYQSFIDRPVYDSDHQFTWANFVRLFASSELTGVVVNSFAFAFLATLISQVLGTLFAVLLGRTDLPGRRVLGGILLWPLVISTLVLGFGWFMAYGPAGFVTMLITTNLGFQPWNLYSIGGMAVVAGTTQVPLALLFCLGSAALADPALEDAARSCGAKPLTILFKITLPLLFPSILYGAVLNFTAALETLSIPLIFGEPVGITLFTTFLFKKGLSGANPDYGLVGTASVLLLVIVMTLVFLQSRMLKNARRFVTVGGKAARPKVFELGRLRWPAFFLVAGYALFLVVLPIGTLALRSLTTFLSPLIAFWNVMTLDNYEQLLIDSTYMAALWNTIVISFAGGIIGTAFIAVTALIVHRSPFVLGKQMEYIALLPRVLPGLVAGIGMFYAAAFVPPIGWLRGTIWVLVLAYIIRAIPTGYGALSPSLLQISQDLDRSARVMGAGWWTSMNTVILPLIKPALFTCFALLFINFFKEYSIAVFIVTPGSEVIGTKLLQIWIQGQMGQVAALATLQIALTALFIVAVRRFAGVKLYG